MPLSLDPAAPDDFDFIIGDWLVRHKRLNARLVNCTDWTAFEGRSSTRSWSIWWLDGRSPMQLDTPVVGKFENRTGVFYADDVLDDKPIKVRFTWEALPDVPPTVVASIFRRRWEDMGNELDDGVR
jgi:hypothetical protein